MTRPEPTTLAVLERPNPFEPRVIRSAIPYVPNQPLAMYLKDIKKPVITLLDGRIVEAKDRMQVIPKAGQQLILAQDLTGGGGGGKGILRALAMVAVLAIAIFLPAIVGAFGYEFISAGWAMAAQAAVMVGGSLLVNAILPPPGMEGKTQEQTYGWAGAQMTAQQGIPIPKQYGRLRRSFNVIESYTTTTLTQQWLNILLDAGFGPAASLTDIEINGNPITNYPGIWADIRLGHNEQAPMANFSDIVNSYPQSTRLRSADGGFTVVGTGTATEAFEVEFTFPKGLWAGPNSDGVSYDPWTVWLRVSYRKVGALDWTTVLQPRTTTDLPLNGDGQAPYWIAVTDAWSPNQTGTAYVMDVSYGVNDHRSGDKYEATVTVPTYDSDGNVSGTQDIKVTGTWILNPAGPGGAQAPGAGANYVAITDYSQVTHGCTYNKPVQVRDVVRVDGLDPGQYEYKVEKLGANQTTAVWGISVSSPINTTTEDTTRRGEETWFSALREIQHAALSYPNKILLGLRALATDKLSGGGLNITAVITMDGAPAMGYKNEVAYDLPEAYFRMGEAAGPACIDITGRGHNGTYSGSPTFGKDGLVVGSPNKAAEFAGGDSASIGNPPACPASGWALEAWLKPSALGGKLFSNADESVYLELGSDGKINFHFDVDADRDLAIASASGTKTTSLVVSGLAQPWSPAVNPTLDFGIHDGQGPVLFPILPGQVLTITAVGGVKPSDSRPYGGPDGNPTLTPTPATGSTGKRFPAYYIPGNTKGLCAVLGAIVDSQFRVLGTPLPIGSALTTSPAPAGAKWLALGVNDDHYSDNTGTFTVTIAVATVPGLVRSANHVVCTLEAGQQHQLAVGDSFTVAGADDAGFDGTFTVDAVYGPGSFGWAQTSADATSGGGSIQITGATGDHKSNVALSTDAVHHVAAGFTAGGFMFLVDGVPEFLSGLVPPTWTPSKIGGGYAGDLDEVAIYNYVVQPGRFRQHFLTGRDGIQSALEDRLADNPALVVIDMLLNPLYGGQQSPLLIDVPAFEAAADFDDQLVSDGTIAPPPDSGLGPFDLPVALDPGEAAVALLTTHGQAFPHDLSYGSLSVDASSGELDRWKSRTFGAADGPGSLRWDTLAALGIDQSRVTRIYGVALVDFDAYSFTYLSGGGPVPFTLYGGGGPASGQLQSLVASGAAAKTIDLSAINVSLSTNSTLPFDLTPPGAELKVLAVGLVVYYSEDTGGEEPTFPQGMIYRHIFNGVFDQSESLWAAVCRVGQMSRTVFMRTGTSYTCVTDAPAARSQLFSMGNIKRDSFKQSWPGLLDRANSISGNFLDETNNWKKTPLRIMDEAAIAAGAALQDAGSVDLFGITNPRAAWRELMYRLLANKAALPMAQLDCALEGIAARIGDVVGLQHDVPQWGAGGRILHATDSSHFKLDQQVTIEADKAYVLTMMMPKVQRASGVVSAVTGNVISVTTPWDGVQPVRRLTAAGIDDKVLVATVDGAGTAYLTVDNPSDFTVGLDVELYDVDVLETQQVTTGSSTTDTIVTVAFSSVPDDFTTYIFGQLDDIQDYRLAAIGRRSDQEMSLQLVKYDPNMYGDLEPTLPEVSGAEDLIAVTDLVVLQGNSSSPSVPTIAVSWKNGKLTYGVKIYVSRSDLGVESLMDDVKGQNFDVLPAAWGYTYTVRVVGYDIRGKSAPYATAPTASIDIGVMSLPQDFVSSDPAVAIEQLAGEATTVRTLAFDVTWKNSVGANSVASYDARSFTISDPGTTPKTKYVTIHDPDRIGDSAGTLTSYCDDDDARARDTDNYVFAGKIIATHDGGNTGSVVGPAGIDQSLGVLA